MTHASTDTKKHAHELIDRMAPGQVSAVVGLLEIMLDPVARSLAAAPYEDELIAKKKTALSPLRKHGLRTTSPSPRRRAG